MSEHAKLTPEQIAQIESIRAEEAAAREAVRAMHDNMTPDTNKRAREAVAALRLNSGDKIAALLAALDTTQAEIAALQATIQAARDSAAHNAAEAERVGALLREADAENARLRRVADNMAGADWTVLPRRSPHTSPEAAEQMAVDGWRFRGYDINRNFLLWYRPWNDVSEQDAANE